jgi:tetratricopeptide (TPR) repeat protein
LAAAERESRRRREPAGPGIAYFRARALLSLGRLEKARAEARRALEIGDVAPWRAERLLALCALYQGDLELALQLAGRSRRGAPEGATALSDYVYALALDRAGDTGAAFSVLARVVARDDSAHRNLLETMLPLHERLYLDALAAQVRRDAASAWRLWQAYLGRDEPGEAERELARRHLSALGPLPDRV